LSVPSAGYETKANWKKHEGSLSMVVSDVGSTPTASTNFPPMYPNIGICCFFSSHMNCGRGMQQNNLDRAGLRG